MSMGLLGSLTNFKLVIPTLRPPVARTFLASKYSSCFLGPISNRSLSLFHNPGTINVQNVSSTSLQLDLLSKVVMSPLLLRFLPVVSVVVSVLALPFDRDSVWHHDGDVSPAVNESTSVPHSDCFPALGFKKPSSVPSSVEGWWCDPATEYAFVGFSYEVSACGFVLFDDILRCQLTPLRRSDAITAKERIRGYSQ